MSKTHHNWWIYRKLKIDQETATNIVPTQILGSIFVALSGVLLYLDKALLFYNIAIVVPEKFQAIGWDQSTFIWLSAQTITPIFLIFGSWLNAFKLSYLIPLYCYLLQIYFYLFDAHYIDNGYFSLYTVGTLILLVVCLEGIKYIAKRRLLNKIKKAKEDLLNEL